MKPAVRVAYWLVPPLFCLALYWYGIKVWFQADDFAWLSLSRQVHNGASLLRALFEPMAQGTIRPWSERGFFLLFYTFFGLDALPYRLCVFATQFANLALLAHVVWKLTRSRVAAFTAPILWTANSALIVPLSWSSSYNQILCPFFLLSAFALFLRFAGGGRLRDYLLQLGIFILGFGALEINIVYPAIAAAYVLLLDRCRRLILSLIPLVAVSVIYFFVHHAFSPGQMEGPYALHFDSAIPVTLLNYWAWTFVPMQWPDRAGHIVLLGRITLVVLAAAILSFTAWKAAKRDHVPLFFFAWFLITLAPLLPLRDHVSDYYLSIPAIGIAAIAAAGISEALHSSPAASSAALALAAIYLWLQIPESHFGVRWYFERSRSARALVLGVARARELHPGKAILLTGIGDDLYTSAIAHSPFAALGIPDVYLAPETAASITSHPGLNDLAMYLLPPEPARKALETEQVEVYSPGPVRLQNVTSLYEKKLLAKAAPGLPRRVDAGNRLESYLLGDGWYALEGGYRWMSKRAIVHIGGPRSPNERIALTGYCPKEQLRSGPLEFQVTIDGRPADLITFSDPETPFLRILSVPPSALGKDAIEVSLEVNRTFRGDGDDRKLGLAFGIIEIR